MPRPVSYYRNMPEAVDPISHAYHFGFANITEFIFMPGTSHRFVNHLCAACVIALLAGSYSLPLYGQSSTRGANPRGFDGGQKSPPVQRAVRGPQYELVGPQVLVREVRITGNKTVKTDKIYSYLKTRKDRIFDPEVVQADVRALSLTSLFRDVRTYTEKQYGGVVVTF